MKSYVIIPSSGDINKIQQGISFLLTGRAGQNLQYFCINLES